MSEDILTNKILESGFIEAFFDNYYYLKNDKTSSDDRLDFDLCISKKEKIKLTKNKLKECNEIIKKSAYSDISSDFIRDYRNFTSEKDEIKVFANYYKNEITSFEPITNFFTYHDNSLSIQNFYRFNYPEHLQPNIIDVEDIWGQEERLLNFLLDTVENFENSEFWDIDFEEINFFIDYSIPIKKITDLAELYFQIKRMFSYRYLLEEADNNNLKNNDKTTFTKKLEEFFIQTNYCLVLNPEVLLLSEKGNINLMLEPQHYIKIINDYQIDCPFVIEEKIQELKNLMIKENISVEDGISIFESYKNYHNPIDSVLIFQPILDLLNKGLKRINPLISEKEITKEHISLNNYYIGIKNDFHNQLYKSLFTTESVILNNTKRDELNITNLDTQLSSEFVESELRLKIKKYLNFYQEQCPRKHKQILKDEDFNKLIEWTFNYYENNFKVPKITEPIEIVNTNKTFVQLSFKYLFKELHNSAYPKTLFEFYKQAFKKYRDDKRENFESVRNNDEVKKLMNIKF